MKFLFLLFLIFLLPTLVSATPDAGYEGEDENNRVARKYNSIDELAEALKNPAERTKDAFQEFRDGDYQWYLQELRPYLWDALEHGTSTVRYEAALTLNHYQAFKTNEEKIKVAMTLFLTEALQDDFVNYGEALLKMQVYTWADEIFNDPDNLKSYLNLNRQATSDGPDTYQQWEVPRLAVQKLIAAFPEAGAQQKFSGSELNELSLLLEAAHSFQIDKAGFHQKLVDLFVRDSSEIALFKVEESPHDVSNAARSLQRKIYDYWKDHQPKDPKTLAPLWALKPDVWAKRTPMLNHQTPQAYALEVVKRLATPTEDAPQLLDGIRVQLRTLSELPYLWDPNTRAAYDEAMRTALKNPVTAEVLFKFNVQELNRFSGHVFERKHLSKMTDVLNKLYTGPEVINHDADSIVMNHALAFLAALKPKTASERAAARKALPTFVNFLHYYGREKPRDAWSSEQVWKICNLLQEWKEFASVSPQMRGALLAAYKVGAHVFVDEFDEPAGRFADKIIGTLKPDWNKLTASEFEIFLSFPDRMIPGDNHWKLLEEQLPLRPNVQEKLLKNLKLSDQELNWSLRLLNFLAQKKALSPTISKKLLELASSDPRIRMHMKYMTPELARNHLGLENIPISFSKKDGLKYFISPIPFIQRFNNAEISAEEMTQLIEEILVLAQYDKADAKIFPGRDESRKTLFDGSFLNTFLEGEVDFSKFVDQVLPFLERAHPEDRTSNELARLSVLLLRRMNFQRLTRDQQVRVRDALIKQVSFSERDYQRVSLEKANLRVVAAELLTRRFLTEARAQAPIHSLMSDADPLVQQRVLEALASQDLSRVSHAPAIEKTMRTPYFRTQIRTDLSPCTRLTAQMEKLFKELNPEPGAF